ncbi:SLC13 family permease [Microbaculum sp. FT89]|uniref:SLC13 family permease n=1 Tax=Microbaculum sp. FT89 TaxID=3447298 RepID=UPI003F536EC3
MSVDSTTAATPRSRLTGLFAGPAIALAMSLWGAPEGLDPVAWHTAAIAILMATWWMSEALPLAATAMVPLALFPLAGIATIERAASSYAHPLIFLFLGGFIIARAMARWQLHRRLAWWVLHYAGSGPAAIIAGIMATTAFLSMWISNTATAMVMLPIGQSIAATMSEHGDDPAMARGFSAALMLSIAYSATIGGMGSLIGTPPNALLAGYMQDLQGIEIGFADWMLVGVPTVIVLLPVTWVLLTKIAFDVPWRAIHAGPAHEIPAPGPMMREEKLVAAIMVLVALAWLTRPLMEHLFPGLPLGDTGIAMIGALALFIIPARPKTGGRLLGWSDLKDLRWDVLILFGGGLALASAIGSSGLSDWIGAHLADMEALPGWLMILVVMTVIVYLGELASNTAMAAVFLPVAGAAAIGMGENALTLALPVALAASLGFMLPVATPPNAIVFGSGSLDARQMLRVGAVLDVVSILIVAVIALTLAPLVFPI